MYEGSNFQHHCHLSLLSLFLIVAILVGMNSYLIVVLICISLMDKDAEICCLVLIGHLYIFFGEISNQTFGPFLNWAIYVFIIENLRILYILWIQVLIRCMTYKYFFLFGGLSYHFIDSIVYNKSVKNFNEIQFIFFFFHSCAFGAICEKTFPSRVKKIYSCVTPSFK